jgi:hypothetical protein
MERNLAQGDLMAVRRGMGGAHKRSILTYWARESLTGLLSCYRSWIKRTRTAHSVPVEMSRIMF